MATPHVAGLAGLLLSVNPNLTVSQLRNAILNTVDRKASLSGKVSTGGRINAPGRIGQCGGKFHGHRQQDGRPAQLHPILPELTVDRHALDSFPKGAPPPLPQHPILGLPSQGGVEIAQELVPVRLPKMQLSPQPSTLRHRRPLSDSGGGGCTLAPGATGDMLLPAMLVMSLVVLLWRVRRR